MFGGVETGFGNTSKHDLVSRVQVGQKTYEDVQVFSKAACLSI